MDKFTVRKDKASSQDLKIIQSISTSKNKASGVSSTSSGDKVSVELGIINNLGTARAGANRIGDDRVSIDLTDVYKSLSILGDTIIKELDTILKEEVPGGIASLDPDQFTPEKTAQRIVDGSLMLYGVFEKQYAKKNPEAKEEEITEKFMSTIRGGISKGYAQASSILGDLGAFEFDGVKSGIEETMRLVEEKLKAFEESKTVNKDPKPEVVKSDIS